MTYKPPSTKAESMIASVALSLMREAGYHIKMKDCTLDLSQPARRQLMRITKRARETCPWARVTADDMLNICVLLGLIRASRIFGVAQGFTHYDDKE